MPEFSSHLLSEPISVGPYKLPNRVFLAPMSGVTDVPFRSLASEFGAGLVVSEMVASEALLEGEAEMQLKIQNSGSPMHMVQIAGREAKWMSLAAQMAEECGARIIDINMGCPARRVTTGYSGSALMRDIDHAERLIEATVKAVSVPVTLKMRLGWDDQSINAPELAQRAENSGVSMITVHGRTRCQFYKGNADWSKVLAVREVTKLPLVVNGDIRCEHSAISALKLSGADAVMVGRGAYGTPWRPGELAGAISHNRAKELLRDPKIVLRHHQSMLEFYGEISGIRQARKHLSWYFSNLKLPPSAGQTKSKILTSFDIHEIQDLTTKLYELADSNSYQSEMAA